ncbi:MAG: T9SS type A sorting domain-containing protein [Saprospiraceae bacterium]
MKHKYLLIFGAFIFSMTSLSAQLSLDVQGAGKIGGNLEIDNGNLSVDISNFLNFTRADNTAGGYIQGLTQGVLLGHNRGGNNATMGVNEGNIVFNTGGSDLAERMRINKVGNVGIGITTPKKKLHVNGDYYGRGYLHLYAFEGDGNDGVAYVQGKDDSGTSSIALRFRTQNAGSSFDAMHISNAGDVGIGVTAPKEKLHVDGDYYGRGHLHLYAFEGDGNDGVAYIQGKDDSGTSSIALRFRTQNAGSGFDAMHISNAGDVGIGVVTPKEKLHVDGDYYGRGHLYLYAFEGDGNDGVAYIQGRDDSGTSNIALQFRTQNAGSSFDAMHISNAGDVGIGISNPQSKLHVNGNVRLEQIPTGIGALLVIDENGNVFKNSTNVQADMERLDNLEKENADLRSRLEQLESYMSSMMEGRKKMENSNTLVLTVPQLQQNQPNPFNGQTTIQYFLPEATQTAQLQINDQNGRVLKVEMLQGNGHGQITLDAKALPQGTYSYSLLVDGQLVETKQMILAK